MYIFIANIRYFIVFIKNMHIDTLTFHEKISIILRHTFGCDAPFTTKHVDSGIERKTVCFVFTS